MDFFQSHQTVPLLSYLLPYSERSIALVKRLAGSPKGAEIDPNLPHANKSYTCSTRILIYMDGSLSVAPNQPKLLSYLFHIPERSIALVKNWLVHQKELKLIPTCPTLTKVLPSSTRILIYIDGLFQSHQTVPKPAILPSSIFPERSIALETTGSPKGAEIDPNLPHAKKVLLKVAHAFLYMDFFSSHQIQACYLLPYS
jgi:hypothetical protein